MNYWSNNNFVAVQSYGGQLLRLPPVVYATVDQYGAERFGRLILAQSESVGLKGLRELAHRVLESFGQYRQRRQVHGVS